MPACRERAELQTRLFAYRYNEAQQHNALVVLGLQHELARMSEELASMRLCQAQNVVSSPTVPSFIDQFRSGRQIQHLGLGVVSRSDRLTMSEIDLFDLAITGEKTGTLDGDNEAKIAI